MNKLLLQENQAFRDLISIQYSYYHVGFFQHDWGILIASLRCMCIWAPVWRNCSPLKNIIALPSQDYRLPFSNKLKCWFSTKWHPPCAFKILWYQTSGPIVHDHFVTREFSQLKQIMIHHHCFFHILGDKPEGSNRTAQKPNINVL